MTNKGFFVTNPLRVFGPKMKFVTIDLCVNL